MTEKQIFYIGKFGEETTELQDGGMVKLAEMFSVGTHRGTEYTEKDLETLASNFNKADEVPIQLDHSHSARDTVGYIEEVSVKEGKLLGKLKIIDEYAQERVKKGLLKKLSIGFYLKETEEGFKPHALREVSLVAFPQVKSARLFSENGYVSDYEEKEVTKVADNKDIQTVNLEEITKQVQAQVTAQFEQKIADLKTELDKLADVEEKFNEQQIDNKIEKFSADSKVVPAQKDALKDLLASFSAEQMAKFEEFMNNSQKVDFSEQAEFTQENGENKEKDTRTPEQKEFDEFYEQHTKTYGSKL